MTPPNAVSLLGFALTLIGCSRLDSWQGLGFVIIGRAFDVLDGWLARKYHQTSRTGAILDASLDKLALLAIILAAWHYDLAPTAALVGIIAINVLIMAATYIAARRHPQQTFAVSWQGKYAMALQNLALGLYVAGTLTATDMTQRNGAEAAVDLWLTGCGHLTALAGVAVFGVWAAYGYIRRI